MFITFFLNSSINLQNISEGSAFYRLIRWANFAGGEKRDNVNRCTISKTASRNTRNVKQRIAVRVEILYTIRSVSNDACNGQIRDFLDFGGGTGSFEIPRRSASTSSRTAMAGRAARSPETNALSVRVDDENPSRAAAQSNLAKRCERQRYPFPLLSDRFPFLSLFAIFFFSLFLFYTY